MGWFVSALEVAHRLAAIGEKMKSLEDARRDAIAIYFEAVSDTLLQISRCIEKKERTEYLLGKLEVYGLELPEVCRGLLPEDDAQRLATQLPGYYPPGNLLDIHEPDAGEVSIDMVAEYARCAGGFKALAETVRAKK